MATAFQPVSREDMEALWASVASSVASDHGDPRAGIFGPASVSWKVNRESALFLGAGRASLLQLAHPWVATALDQHSNLRNDPLARFHGTFRIVFIMIFGTLEQALSASRHLYHLHTHVEGELAEDVAGYSHGSHYQANEVSALLWVYATLIESALLAYETVLPPLSCSERETYYSESKTMAALFGIPASALPQSWSDFEAYSSGMIESDALGGNALSRELGGRVLHGRGSWVPVPRWYRALTAGWMSERFQREFGLPYGIGEQNAQARARRWLPRIYGRLPKIVRFVGPYHEALLRLEGRPAGLITRANNRFWMGVPRMMFTRPDA